MATDCSSSLAQTLQMSVQQSLTYHTHMLSLALEQLRTCSPILTEISLRIITALQTGHKVLVAGNGGSAAEAQHFAAELVGRFQQERAAYAAIALSANIALLTALANDYGYQQIFARQIRAIGQPDDLFLDFSTSGESENLVQAALVGRERLVGVIAIISDKACRLEQVADITLRIPTIHTAITQELHMMVTHLLCEIVEQHLASAPLQKQLMR